MLNANSLYEPLVPKNEYYDKKSKLSPEAYRMMLKNSTTLYVGNLSWNISEEAIYELFSKCGELKLLTMGLDRKTKTFCGFYFVEYFTHEDAKIAVDWLNNTMLGDKKIRVDWDVGFSEGRQYGRGKSGGQVRDEHRRNEEGERDYPQKYGNGGHRGYHDKGYIRKRDNFEVY